MKVRMGFVSNSSSSSFCLMGIYIPDEDEEILEILVDDATREKFKETDDRYTFFDDLGFSVCDDENDGSCVGVSIDEWDFDKTVNQIRSEVTDSLKKVFKDQDAGVIYGTSYDG